MYYLVTAHFVVQGNWGSTIDMEQSVAARLAEISEDDGGAAVPEGVSVYARPFTDVALAEVVSHQIDFDEVDVSPDGLVGTLCDFMENMEQNAHDSAEYLDEARELIAAEYKVTPGSDAELRGRKL